LPAFATNLAPSLTSSVSTTPTFTWTYPANASSYTYSFNLCCNNNSGNNNIWQIPGQNSNSNGGFSSSISPSIPWITSGNDITGASGNLPNPSSGLTLGTTYQWQIQTEDTNGNTATQSVSYTP